MNTTIILKELGLSKQEAKVYLAALEEGVGSGASIAKRALIQRTSFYDISRKLIEKGFLHQTKEKNKLIFTAEKPEILYTLQKKRLEKLESVLPELKALHNIHGVKPRITYYEGRVGIDYINQDTLRYHGEIIGFTTPNFVKFDGEKISQAYIQERIVRKNRVRVIGEVSSEILRLKQQDSQELRETRMLPQQIFHSEVELGIYGRKVFVIDYKQAFGFIIESEEISSMLKMIFEIIWGSGRIVD